MRRTILALPLLAAACGEPDIDLWGSIDETFSLDFDEHQIAKQQTFLIIEYIKKLGKGAEETPAKLVVDTANLKISPNSSLAAEYFLDGTVGLERVAASGGDFPPISGGTLTFEEYVFVRDGTVSGNFTILFENGRNLFGNFYGQVKLIEEL